jgi:hypothetical protein
MDTAETDLRATIAARLESSTDPELLAAATRWQEISGDWMAEVFTDEVKRELDFHEHHAGYRDPYQLFELARSRGTTLDKDTRQVLLDYTIAVMGVYELVHFHIVGALIAVPDPWTPA